MGKVRFGFTPEENNEDEFERSGNNLPIIPLYIEQPTIDDPDEWVDDE